MANSGSEILIEEIKKLCLNNAEYFKKDDSENGQRLRLGFLGMMDHVNLILPLVDNIQKIMASYDFDVNIPGNGYRSFVIVAQASFKHALQLCNYIAIHKDSILFRKSFYAKEVEAASHMIASLASCFQHLHTLLNWSEPGELFPTSDHVSEMLLDQSETVNQYAFYGRCLGIQFCKSVQPLLKFISTFMASFSEVYYNIGSFSAKAHGLFSGGKFLIDPELRARRIVNISQYASIDFCKSFWFLAESELMKKIPDFVCNAIAINTEIEIPPEPLKIHNSVGEEVDIPIPSSHIEVSPIQVRLLSSNRHEGMISVSSDVDKRTAVVPPSEGLILHCHGGGFVAQSSKSHEVYLRDWANFLNVPIISVDYSLAPDAPFPRALEEVFYAYCWALKNSHILGSSAKTIIFAGDSAGANLLLGTALKCIEFDIRKPDGLFLAYIPVIVSSMPSPSRLLCLMDPLLPIGFLLRCLKAYACPPNKKSVEIQNSDANGPIGNCTSESQSEVDKSKIDASRFSSATESGSDTSVRNVAVSPNSKEMRKLCETENGKLPKKTNEKDGLENWEQSQEEKDLGLSPEGIDDRDKNFKNAFISLKKKVSSLISNTIKIVAKRDIDKALTGNEMENLLNPFKEFKFSVPKDPYLSPYWARDDVLNQLPPTSLCSVQFDPCLDDCVMLAKKLRKLGNKVSLDVLEGLPHGFLNFSKVSVMFHESALDVKLIMDPAIAKSYIKLVQCGGAGIEKDLSEPASRPLKGFTANEKT